MLLLKLLGRADTVFFAMRALPSHAGQATAMPVKATEPLELGEFTRKIMNCHNVVQASVPMKPSSRRAEGFQGQCFKLAVPKVVTACGDVADEETVRSWAKAADSAGLLVSVQKVPPVDRALYSWLTSEKHPQTPYIIIPSADYFANAQDGIQYIKSRLGLGEWGSDGVTNNAVLFLLHSETRLFILSCALLAAPGTPQVSAGHIALPPPSPGQYQTAACVPVCPDHCHQPANTLARVQDQATLMQQRSHHRSSHQARMMQVSAGADDRDRSNTRDGTGCTLLPILWCPQYCG